MTDAPDPPIHRYNVSFEAVEVGQGRSIVTLALSRDGQAAGQDTLFFFETIEEMTPQATAQLARFLSKYIARFGVVTAEAADPEEG